MPTPLEILLDPISLIVIFLYVGLMICEALFPARPLPRIKYWKVKGVFFFAIYFYLSSYLPMLWNTYLSAYQVFDLTDLGTVWGAVAGILIYQFGVYVWHWSMHKNNLLWRVFHQMHHSAERVDTYGAFLFSPMDMIGYTVLGSLLLVLVAGFSPQASTIILLVNTFFSKFQHANIHAPSWLDISYSGRKPMPCIMPKVFMPITTLTLPFTISCLAPGRIRRVLNMKTDFIMEHHPV